MTTREKRDLFAMTYVSGELREKAIERGDEYNLGYHVGYNEALLHMIYSGGLEREYERYLIKKECAK